LIHKVSSGKCLVSILFILTFFLDAMPCRADTSPLFQKTFLQYTLNDKKTGEQKGEVRIQITQKGKTQEWLEVRKFNEDETDTFLVIFDPQTLLPVNYTRETEGLNGSRILELTLDGRELTATITDIKGKTSTQSLRLPEGSFVIEPFMKYYLTRLVDTPSRKGNFISIGLLNDKIKAFPIKWEIVGNATIETPAGKFDCLDIVVSSPSWYLKLINKGTHVLLDASGDHQIIRTPARKSLLSEELVMVLIRVEKTPPDNASE